MRGHNLSKDRPKKEDRLKALGGLEPLGGDEVGVTVRVRVDKAYLTRVKALSAKERGQAIAAWIEQRGVGNGKEG